MTNTKKNEDERNKMTIKRTTNNRTAAEAVEVTAEAQDKPSDPANPLIGTYTANAKGFGFVTVEGFERDLFIPRESVNGAFHQDTVEVRLLPTFQGNIIPGGKGVQRQEAEVVRIVKRGITTLVGTVVKENKKIYVRPDNAKIGIDILIKPKNAMKAVNGHKVVCQMIDYGGIGDHRKPEGKITQILGHMDDPGVDILSIIKAYNLPEEFPDDVKREVTRIPQALTLPAASKKEKLTGDLTGASSAEHKMPEIDGREDWRSVTTVTIDGPDTKDIDDAISVQRDGQDYILGVHIADVSQYVRENTPLDQEALKRATSIYLVDRVIPMLPHELSNGICSLNQGEDRYALSCIMRVDKKGEVKDSRVVETIIRSDGKLSYPGVMNVFAGDDSEIVHALEMQGFKRGIKTRTKDITAMLKRGLRLAAILRKKRQERGAIDFEFQESEIHLDPNGKPIEIVPHDRNDATDMIEDFMLLANETVASTFYWMDIPFVYRTHGRPAEEKIRALRVFIKNYGYTLKSKDAEIHPKELQNLLERLKGKPEEAMLSTMTLRSMQRASYTPTCEGHFGLALRYYCHFTSPIRRYPDLQIHRIIKEFLHGKLGDERREHYEGILPYVCKQSSERERLADEAERETDKQKKAEYMAERLGEIYQGAISGITGWGFYVALPDSVEGLVPVGSLHDDYYNFDEDSYILRGEHSGRTFSLGQKVYVQVAGADIVARTVDFKWLPDKKALKMLGQADASSVNTTENIDSSTVSSLHEGAEESEGSSSMANSEDAGSGSRSGRGKKPKKLRGDGSAFIPKKKKSRHHGHKVTAQGSKGRFTGGRRKG